MLITEFADYYISNKKRSSVVSSKCGKGVRNKVDIYEFYQLYPINKVCNMVFLKLYA